MQREITSSQTLLDNKGVLMKPGYARKMVFDYNREQIKAGPFSLKEWDFYQAISGDYVLQLTIGHVSYVANFSAMLFNIKTGEKRSFSRMKALPMRGMAMPRNPEQPNVLEASGKDYRMRYETRKDQRRLIMQADDKQLGKVDIDLVLNNDPDNEKLVIATPFFKKNQFYLNYKENYYGLSGYA